jgi:hypothetical protein
MKKKLIQSGPAQMGGQTDSQTSNMKKNLIQSGPAQMGGRTDS